jgi:ribonuclease HI
MTSSFPIFFRFADGASQHTHNISSTTWVIYHYDKLVSSRGIFLGLATNNNNKLVVIGILTKAYSLGISHMIINMESQLVVCQLN